MLYQEDEHLDGPTQGTTITIRPARPAIVVADRPSTLAAIDGASTMAGGLWCHLIPKLDSELGSEWLEYLERVSPDIVHDPGAALSDAERDRINAMGMQVRSAERAPGDPTWWRSSPFVLQFAAEDAQKNSQTTIVVVNSERGAGSGLPSELQTAARFGRIAELTERTMQMFVQMEGVRLDTFVRVERASPLLTSAEWLVGDLTPAPGEPYAVGGARIYAPIRFGARGIVLPGRTVPRHRYDAPQSLFDRFFVLGGEDSVTAACAFWNLRANRSLASTFPFWVTPEQLALDGVAQAIRGRPPRPLPLFGLSAAEIESSRQVHCIAPDMSQEEASAALTAAGVDAVVWSMGEWIRFVDRRVQPLFHRRTENLHFRRGAATVLIPSESFPLRSRHEVTVEALLPDIQPPPGDWAPVVWGQMPTTFTNQGARSAPITYDPFVGNQEFSIGFQPPSRLIRHGMETKGFAVSW